MEGFVYDKNALTKLLAAHKSAYRNFKRLLSNPALNIALVQHIVSNPIILTYMQYTDNKENAPKHVIEEIQKYFSEVLDEEEKEENQKRFFLPLEVAIQIKVLLEIPSNKPVLFITKLDELIKQVRNLS